MGSELRDGKDLQEQCHELELIKADDAEQCMLSRSRTIDSRCFVQLQPSNEATFPFRYLDSVKCESAASMSLQFIVVNFRHTLARTLHMCRKEHTNLYFLWRSMACLGPHFLTPESPCTRLGGPLLSIFPRFKAHAFIW